MDHLKTSQERRDRWYARHIKPKCVSVKPADDWSDLCQEKKEYGTGVYSLPFQWLYQVCGSEPATNMSVSAKLRRALDCHGFLIISGVLERDECDQALDAAWNWIEAASEAERHQQATTGVNGRKELLLPVHRQDLSTLESPYFPRSVEGGMMPYYGSGHSRFAWMIRSNPKVKKVFETYHDETNLLSSLDGIVLWRGGSKFRTDPGWFHLDQNPRFKPGQCCLQGLVNLLPANEQTGGNVVVAHSHKRFPHHYDGSSRHDCSDFYSQRLDELGNEDWMEIDPNDELLQDPSKVISCRMQAGDVLLWDSRTVHCSYPAEPADDSTSQSGLIRAATAVSMMPASAVSAQVLESRKAAVDQSRTLTHWVDKVAPLGEEHSDHVQREKACVATIWEHSQARNAPCPLMRFEHLTEDQRDLVVGKRP